MSDHAYLPPSGAPQWGHCSGAPRAQDGLPDPYHQRTEEGTAAHWVGSEVLLNYREQGRGPLVCSAYLGQKAPNGLIVDDEMVEGAQVWVSDVLKVCQQFGALQRMLVEHRVHMPQIHPELNWGTLDTGLYLPERKVIFLWDYKHGHREVSPRDNFQLIDYVAGIVNEYQIDGFESNQTTVVMRIVQPFAYYASGPIREHVCILSDLRAQWNTLRNQGHAAVNSPTLTPGAWCRDCKAVGQCSAARKALYDWMELEESP